MRQTNQRSSEETESTTSSHSEVPPGYQEVTRGSWTYQISRSKRDLKVRAADALDERGNG